VIYDANAWNAGMPECYDSAVLSVSKPGKPASQISEKYMKLST